MNARPIVALVAAGVSLCVSPALAEETPAKHNSTVQWMIEQARAWADQACGGKWVISELFAEDFKGTSPKGGRYEKPTGEPPNDPKTQWSTNCTLDEADVRFFWARRCGHVRRRVQDRCAGGWKTGAALSGVD